MSLCVTSVLKWKFRIRIWRDNMHPLVEKLQEMSRNKNNDPEYNEGLREAADQASIMLEPIEVLAPGMYVSFDGKSPTDYLGMVREFHTKFNHHTQTTPGIPAYEIMELREKLITEEAEEFHAAIYGTNYSGDSHHLVEIADAIGDLLYVVFGAALAFGIPIAEVFTEIHRSNMTKSTEKNEFGKSLKGDYSPADIRSVLAKYV